VLGPSAPKGVAEGVAEGGAATGLLEPITIAGWKWFTSGPLADGVDGLPSNSARALEVTLTWDPGGLARLSEPVHLRRQQRLGPERAH